MLIYHQKQHSRDNLPSLNTLNLAQKRMFLSVDKYETPVSTTPKRKRQRQNSNSEN